MPYILGRKPGSYFSNKRVRGENDVEKKLPYAQRMRWTNGCGTRAAGDRLERPNEERKVMAQATMEDLFEDIQRLRVCSFAGAGACGCARDYRSP